MTSTSSAGDTSPKPGRLIEVEAVDLDRDGHGLARWMGWVIVVPDLLPGERAQVQLQKRQRSRWLSRRISLIRASDGRRRPPCILAADCGGCTLQHLDDAGQSQWKRTSLSETMSRLGQIGTDPRPVLSDLQRAVGYRNRALIPMHRGTDGRLRLGYFRRGSHRIINLNRCPVLDPRLDALIQPLKHDLQATGWPADHDLAMGGGLRHLGLRVAHHSGELLITLVSSHDRLPGLKKLADRWMSRWPMLRGVTLNLQPKRTNLILGIETRLIAGRETIEEQVCSQRLQLSSTTFFQVNTPQAESILTELRQWFLQTIGLGRVVDAFCGVGTISLPLAAAGFDVLGIELHDSSVEQARLNASLNGFEDRCRFLAGDVADLLAAALPGMDALVLDPPRRGLDKRVVESILNNPPPLLAYLSCDPATQARDLKALLEPRGLYRLRRLQPVDFFPQTTHLESLALLERISCAVQPEIPWREPI